jgi:pimeloyl-ACP methyl ester carboxylesterase
MTMPPSRAAARVLVVPGGGSQAHGYFPGLAESLGPEALIVEADPPGFDLAAGRRWLKPTDHAWWLGQAVRRDGEGPVVVVGHSLGALIALRFTLDEPEQVAGLLLLDPSPPVLAALLPRPLLALIGGTRRVGAALRRGARRTPTKHASPTSPRSVPLWRRLWWFFLVGGVTLAADVAAGRVAIPVVLVSASEHAPEAATRRAHERLARWVPGASFEVWPNTTHALHLERPDRVAEATRSLLRRRAELDPR